MSESLLKMSEVIGRTTLTETEIRRRMAAGTFPKSIPIGDARVAWLESEVNEWIAEQIRAARPTSKPTEG